jgi:hypothetical protein
MAYGGLGRRERFPSRQNLNAEAWCSNHQRYYRTHMKVGCRVIPTDVGRNARRASTTICVRADEPSSYPD